MGDGAEVLDQFAVRHADAGIGDGDGLRLVVGRDGDVQGVSGWKIGLPEVWRKRSFSQASAALETSSRTKISLSV